MTLVGEIRVAGLFDSRKIDAGVAKAKKSFRSMGDSAAGLQRKFEQMKPSIMAIAGGVGAGLSGLAYAADRMATAEQESQRLAIGLGITRVSLLRYQQAANSLGISQDVVNDALRELNRRSAEAVTGTGSMADSLKVLNIDAAEFVKMRLEDKFSLIANKLSGLQSTAQRGFLTDEIFGGASDEITGSVKRLDDLARSIDGVKAAAQAEQLSQFSKDWKEITTDLKQAGRGLLIDVGPLVVDTIRSLRDTLEAAGVIKERKRDRSSESFLFDEKTTVGNAPVKALAGALSIGFLVNSNNARVQAQNSRLQRNIDRERLNQFREPQVNARPVQMVPSNL